MLVEIFQPVVLLLEFDVPRQCRSSKPLGGDVRERRMEA